MAKRERKKTEASLEVGDRLPFGELALLFGFISREDLSLALRDQVLKDQKIGKLLINQGSITKDEARKILKCQKRDGPIEGYVLIQRIGSGGMGTVYKSTQKSLNRTVAIKILNREAAGNDIQRRRFIQEAHLLAQLQHPNLIQCFDIGESNDLVYLVMEFVEGRNAREVLNHEGRYDEETALTYLAQCLEGMIHYHEKSIIHRDIKPENLLLSEEGVMKITDLGLSKQLTNDLFLTRVGKTVGTPYYISPELAKGQASIDIRSDLYSLGATFYHLMCGVPPFDGDSSAEILTKHVREDAEKPSKWNEELSKSVDHILLKMLEKAPKKRYQDPEEALADVQSLLDNGKLSSEVTRRRTTSINAAVRQSGVRPTGVRSSGVIRGARNNRNASSGIRSSGTRTRASGVIRNRERSNLSRSASGAHRRQNAASPRAPSKGKEANKAPLIIGGALALLLFLGIGFGLGVNSSKTNGQDPDNVEAKLEIEREQLVQDLKVSPGDAITKLETWSRSAPHDEAIRRWEIVLKNKSILTVDDIDRAKLGLDRSQRDFEQEASDSLDKIRNKVYEHIDNDRIEEARQSLAEYSPRFKSTQAWKDWQRLKEQVENER